MLTSLRKAKRAVRSSALAPVRACASRGPLAALGLVVVFSSCGDAAPPSQAATSATEKIGKGGGAIQLRDGTRIEVPPGALDGEVALTLEKLPTAAPASLGALSSEYRLSPEAIAFLKPAHATVPLSSKSSEVSLYLARVGAPSWQELDATATGSDASGSLPSGGSFVAGASAGQLPHIPCESYVGASQCGKDEVSVDGGCAKKFKPGSDASFPSGCAFSGAIMGELACPPQEVDVACDDTNSPVICFCGDVDDSIPAGGGGSGRGTKPACASGSDPCGVSCSSITVGGGCVFNVGGTIPLNEVVPAQLWSSGGSAPYGVDVTVTVTLDLSTCTITIKDSGPCGTSVPTPTVDLGAGTCTWWQSFAIGGECQQACAVDCNVD